MFGYVIADQNALSEEERARFQSCYCGLCRTIYREYGSLQRFALNYDMVFLVLLLQSLYEPEEVHSTHRCMLHPTQPRPIVSSSILSYGAAMNIALTYYKEMDDWQDDKKLSALAFASLFRRNLPLAENCYPRQCRAIDQCIRQLKDYEQQDLQEPDPGANAFGALMGELFVLQEDNWAQPLRIIGNALGRYIYLLDAAIDLQDDIKKNRYNPLKRMYNDGWTLEEFRPVLTLLIGECTQAFESLPLVQDIHLLRNILYSGIWSKLNWAISRKENNHV